MRKTTLVSALIAGVAGVDAGALPYDGLYIPRGQGGGHWTCEFTDRDGGAMMILGAMYDPGAGPACQLTNPVKVRGLPAVLYDVKCYTYNTPEERVMFVWRGDGMLEIRADRMIDWEMCGEK